MFRYKSTGLEFDSPISPTTFEDSVDFERFLTPTSNRLALIDAEH
jgi:hypothetical protein